MADPHPTSKPVQMWLTGDGLEPGYHVLCADGSIWRTSPGSSRLRWYPVLRALTESAPDLAAEVADLHDIVRQLNRRLTMLETKLV